MDTRNRISMKSDTAQRLIMCNMLSGLLPLYIVTEYPKSGGTWVAQMIADYLQLPFPRNVRPKIESCMMHGHMKYSPFMKNVICLFRDGRDVMVSSYFHMLFQNEKNPPRLVEKTRKDLSFNDYDDVKSNLPKFIEYNFEMRKNSYNPNKFTWSEFVNSWADKDVCKIKYEDMVYQGKETLSTALNVVTGREIDELKVESIIDKFSFEKQANRKPGIEVSSSFLRKGSPGDWKEKFTKEAAEVFNAYAGVELIKLGYEDNADWVDSVK